MKKLSFRGLIGLVALIALAFSAAALGADGQPFIDAAKYVLGILTGGLARTVAVIVVCVLGYMLLSGRIEFRRAIILIAGIILIFASGYLATELIANVA